MQLIDGRFVYSASDLNDDLECRYLTGLKEDVALGKRRRPERSESAQLIADKGNLHEERHLAEYRRRYDGGMVEFPSRVDPTFAAMHAAEAETLAAMERGAHAIYQAFFFDGVFQGRADFLERVERPCAKWPWSYEVVDTKLAMGAKPYFIIQLCAYSEHVARLQGSLPECAHVILGSGERETFAVNDFMAYFRRRKQSFLQSREEPGNIYPVECAHCASCDWAQEWCEPMRDADDYLGLVAAMRTDQIAKLKASGITKIAELAVAANEQRPWGMSQKTYETLRHQAALQHRQRSDERAGIRDGRQYRFDPIPYEPRTGFERLPEPDAGDIYFDMEGDPLYSPGRGLEYLFGVYVPAGDAYHAFWAHNATEEQAAFGGFLAFVRERRARHPNLHVYHYAPYEVAALRRLQARFFRNEDYVDELQRAHVFVDLYAVLRQTLRISQPGYGLKKVEPFYGKRRLTGVKRGDDSIVEFERWLATGEAAILEDIERYNEDDCRSTGMLHHWLLERRREREAALGAAIPWFSEEVPDDETTPKQHPMAAELLGPLPVIENEAELREASEDVRARWLLAHILDYYRREDKPVYWKLFERRRAPELLEEFDSEAIGGLELIVDIAPYKDSPRDRNLVYTYRYPDQQHNLATRNPECPSAEKRAGEIIAHDEGAATIAIKLAATIRPDELRALIPGGPIQRPHHRLAVERFAQAWKDGTLPASQTATLDVLLARPPRLRGHRAGDPVQPADVSAENISAIAGALDGGALMIQGPPGSGKSTKGAHVIVDLLAAGKRVALMSLSHKAIRNLLDKVDEEASRRGLHFTGAYKAKESDGPALDEDAEEQAPRAIKLVDDYNAPHDIAAGTSWVFSREERIGEYDYLFIDEAGQISLADTIACGPCARNIVLLGDPLQLAQVSQGTHPPGAGLSVLQHLLGGEHTVPPDRGIFLNRSYRMHPAICSFISGMVYDGRLQPDERTATHAVASAGYSGSGLRYLPIAHAGNRRESEEEATAIVREAALLLAGRVTVAGKPERPMTQRDILIVAPYNMQRKLIRRKLADAGLSDIRVGTVDKFQGQEAPVVFYSMATSSGDDLPRDMGFLFERNRLNVAVSRAQCLSVLVCSPALLDIRCSGIEEMALANLLCAFAEAAAG